MYYLLFGAIVLTLADFTSADANPLWRGFIFLLWPLWIIYVCGYTFVNWCKDVRDYYKRKKEK